MIKGAEGQESGNDHLGEPADGRDHNAVAQKPRHLAHFSFSTLGQRAFIIGFFPVRPVGFAVPEKIELHVNGVKKLNVTKLKGRNHLMVVRFNFVTCLTF